MMRSTSSFLRQPLLVLALCLIAACGGPPPLEELPPLPAEVRMEDALPAIRSQVREALEQARANPQDAESNGRLGMVLAAYDRLDAALDAFARARLLAPDDYRWAYLYGFLLGQQGRTEEAATALREARALLPGDPHIRIALADQLAAMGQREESRLLYAEAIAQDTKLLRAHLGLGRLQAGEGTLEDAVASFRAALTVDARIGEIHYALAQSLQRLGDQSAANRHFSLSERYKERRARAYDPALAAIGALHRGDRPHMVLARRLIAEGRKEEAVAALQRALEANPQNDVAHTHLVWLFGLAGRPEEAESHYRQAVAINPGNAQLYFNWGHLLRKQGRNDEAEKALGRALDLDPGLASARVQLGFLLEQQGHQAEALAHYREAVRMQPGHRNARYLLGKALAREGEVVEAIAQLRQCLEPEDSRTTVYLRTLASMYVIEGDVEAARDSLEHAQRLALRLGNPTLAQAVESDLHRLANQAAPRQVPEAKP
jgi:Flp pilus assembly protein TadD